MKVICLAVCVLVSVWAESPPSKGYLPPSAGRGNFGSSGGYAASAGSGGLPSVVSARNQAFGGNNFGRSNSFGQTPGAASARFSSNSYGGAAGRSGSGYGGGLARNGGEDGFGEPANYNFDYMVTGDSGLGGAEFGHHEERREETAQGEYHVVLPDGRKQIVSYQADENGFKPRISYEDTDLARSGYDSNSQNFGRSSGHDSFRNGGFPSGRSGGY